MPNLIGTGNNQVPTNGMLGGMAYQSPDNVVIKNLELTNLSGHNSVIPSTATDVFVYDTRKDSDGGAWRKRTQNTSWYNETLNTATRGSRKDFPAVAVIVATTTTVTIYDGDDPDMPMWMVFQSSGYGMSGVYMFNAGSVVNSSIYALNGILVGGQYQASDTYGSPIINFISEKVVRMDPDSSEGGLWLGNIADRNSGKGYASRGSTGQGYAIVDSRINDVAMTVLPNAPIDAATGLPIPTIAVATNGGVSIIKDDGTVANITYTNFNVANFVHFTKDNKIAILTDSATGGARFYRIYEIPTSSLNGGAYNNMGSALRAYGGDIVAYNYPIRYNINISSDFASSNFHANALVYAKDGPVFGRNGRGIALISEGHSNLPGEIIPTLSTSAGMVCGISSSVNTGWMHGDIKGAFLSDTSTASVTGTELITNGTFASGTTGWTAGPSGTISVTSGVLRVTNTVTNGRAVSNTFATVVGQRYILTADGVTQTTTKYYMEVRGPEQSASWTSGTGSLYFTAVGTTTYVELYAIGSGVTYSEYDNVSVRLTEPDRSVNNKGLQVFGTITKSAVASGSNLVAYSGIGTTNYLQQPYNSALDFGSGNFSIMGWINTQNVGGAQFIFNRSTNSTLREFELWVAADLGYMSMWLGGYSLYTSNYAIPNLAWTHFCAFRNSGVAQIYVNGRSVISGILTDSVNTTNPAQILYNCDATTKLSLLRVSASVPSPTQIAKIYNDEKVLFQENSQCTLYGSSDAVTALAYDDSNSLLSVGTSSGRSDFQGLERINNTTTAVTTAISASNGLIAEQ